MANTQTAEQQAAAQNQERRDQRDKALKEQTDQMAKDRADMEKRNLEKMEADAKLRPTPTPEEIQQAVAGHIVDHKESDGAPLQNERHHTLNPAQQIEVGREVKSAEPVGSKADIANQNNPHGVGAAKPAPAPDKK